MADAHSKPKIHKLYRHFSKTGDLLYIGITSRLNIRLREHEKGSPWWGEISRIEIETFSDRESLIDAEKMAILKEKPLYNIHHNEQENVPEPVSWILPVNSVPTKLLRILRPAKTSELVGLCDRQLRDLEAQGLFPKRFALNPSGKGRAVGHLEHEVEAWLQARADCRIAT